MLSKNSPTTWCLVSLLISTDYTANNTTFTFLILMGKYAVHDADESNVIYMLFIQNF
jgi:hypothetical protein